MGTVARLRDEYPFEIFTPTRLLIDPNCRRILRPIKTIHPTELTIKHIEIRDRKILEFFSRKGLVLPIDDCIKLKRAFYSLSDKINALLRDLEMIPTLVWNQHTKREKEETIHGLRSISYRVNFFGQNLALGIRALNLTDKHIKFIRVIVDGVDSQAASTTAYLKSLGFFKLKRQLHIPESLAELAQSSRSKENGFTFLPPLTTKKIARGGNGTVFETILPGIPKTLAVKYCPNDFEPNLEVFYRHVTREAGVPFVLHHPNIISFCGIDLSPDMMCAYFERGCASLHQVSHSEPGTPIREDFFTFLPFYLIDLLRALSFIHKNGIIHRDIKPANILLVKKSKPPKPWEVPRKYEIKIIDFGTCESISHRMRTSGTYDYLHPGAALRLLNDKRTPFNIRLDNWALGMTFLEIFRGTRVFKVDSSTTVEDLLKKISTLTQQKIDTVVDDTMQGPRAKKYLSDSRKYKFVSTCLKMLLLVGGDDVVYPAHILKKLDPIATTLQEQWQDEQRAVSVSEGCASADSFRE